MLAKQILLLQNFALLQIFMLLLQIFALLLQIFALLFGINCTETAPITVKYYFCIYYYIYYIIGDALSLWLAYIGRSLIQLLLKIFIISTRMCFFFNDLELSAYNSEDDKQQDLEDMLKENYEINEYENEDSEYEENEDKLSKEQGGWKPQNEREQETSDENEVRENNEMEESQVKEHKEERKEYDGSKEGIWKFSHSNTDEIQKGKAAVHQIGKQKCWLRSV